MSPSKVNKKTRVGKIGEQIAATFLQKEGYTIIERNFHVRYGEIDLIAEKNGVVVFIEVKTRRGETFGTPEEAVTSYKLRQIIQTIRYYVTIHRIEEKSQRIDCIAILLNPDESVKSMRHIQNISQ